MPNTLFLPQLSFNIGKCGICSHDPAHITILRKRTWTSTLTLFMRLHDLPREILSRCFSYLSTDLLTDIILLKRQLITSIIYGISSAFEDTKLIKLRYWSPLWNLFRPVCTHTQKPWKKVTQMSSSVPLYLGKHFSNAPKSWWNQVNLQWPRIGHPWRLHRMCVSKLSFLSRSWYQSQRHLPFIKKFLWLSEPKYRFE